MNKLSIVFIISLVIAQETVYALTNRIPLRNQCCNIPNRDVEHEFSEKVMEAFRGCYQELSSIDNEEQLFACLSECNGKKLNVYSDDIIVNEKEFRNFIKYEVAKEDFQKAIADAVATKCLDETKSLPKQPAKINNCSTVPITTGFCVEKAMFNACPVHLQDASEQCVEMRKTIESRLRL